MWSCRLRRSTGRPKRSAERLGRRRGSGTRRRVRRRQVGRRTSVLTEASERTASRWSFVYELPCGDPPPHRSGAARGICPSRPGLRHPRTCPWRADRRTGCPPPAHEQIGARVVAQARRVFARVPRPSSSHRRRPRGRRRRVGRNAATRGRPSTSRMSVARASADVHHDHVGVAPRTRPSSPRAWCRAPWRRGRQRPDRPRARRSFARCSARSILGEAKIARRLPSLRLAGLDPVDDDVVDGMAVEVVLGLEAHDLADLVFLEERDRRSRG